MTMTVQDVELKVTVRILEGERKILAQLPQRSNYTKEELKRVVCWVYADAVWRKDVRHQPIMLIELNSGELLWTYPVNAPCVHIRWGRLLDQMHTSTERDDWVDFWKREVIPHAIVR